MKNLIFIGMPAVGKSTQAQPGSCPGLDAGTGRKHHLYGGSLRAGKWSGSACVSPGPC